MLMVCNLIKLGEFDALGEKNYPLNDEVYMD